ncbi:competence/damage-inducible protein A [Halonotius terrestris]|uniref:Competence/damage-inducible protein A n=1 Tax=Halonotius terrestris TaxID=2487750 RepID=A0A8J8P6M8_9EURY|nr:molybdopterin-binding protein [Halonotius terrestris]TQQ79853.1 competence/damage-inducible protein A [Halonotius terrestris]
MNVAIVTIGDELLAGETVDTNGAWLAEQLAARGCTVERITTLPDRIEDIAKVVNEYRAAYDAVLVTGGLGPTHDDMTMAAVARAVGREIEHHPEAEAWLTEEGGYSADNLDEGTTYLPAGARMLPNEVGVAPGAVVESIYVLPGVPAEMKEMFERVATEFSGDPIYTTTVVADEPESQLLDRLADVRQRYAVDVGSYPGEFVRVKFRGTDPDAVDNAAEWFAEQVTVAESDEE